MVIEKYNLYKVHICIIIICKIILMIMVGDVHIDPYKPLFHGSGNFNCRKL